MRGGDRRWLLPVGGGWWRSLVMVAISDELWWLERVGKNNNNNKNKGNQVFVYSFRDFYKYKQKNVNIT